MLKKSAHLPGSREPISSRPSTAAPPRVAISSTSRAVIHSEARRGCDCDSRKSARGPVGGSRPIRSRASSIACRASSRMFDASLLAEPSTPSPRSEEHTSELQSRPHLVCRLLLEKKKKKVRSSRPVEKKKQKQ